VRQRLIWLAIVLGASFYIFAFFVDERTAWGQALELTEVRTGLSTAINVVTTMAIGLGVINLFHVHGRNVRQRKKGWGYSIVVFVTFFVVLGCMLWQYRLDAQARAIHRETEDARRVYQAAFALDDPVARDEALRELSAEELQLVSRYYDYHATYRFEPLRFYLNYFVNALAPTVMSLLGFYITFAAYRAFRLRSVEATVMTVAAAVVILGSDAIGGWLSTGINGLFGGQRVVWLPQWADFGNRVLLSGMERGLAIGIGVAVIAVSLRIVLGMERGLIRGHGTEG
jgi:hypothetical protein